MNWYALHVRSNCERRVTRWLTEASIDSYFASYEVRSRDKKRVIERNLLPGYLFARFDADDARQRHQVIVIPELVRIVGTGREPASIPDREVEAVRKLTTQAPRQAEVIPFPFLSEGQSVVVTSGPLSGLEGFVVQQRGNVRIVVSVNLLHRSVSAEIDVNCLRPTGPRPQPSQPNLALAA